VGRACSTHREKKYAYGILMGNPEGERRVGRPIRSWEDNTRIKMDLREIEWGGMGWILLAQDKDQWKIL
jgi:hypothetical protein